MHETYTLETTLVTDSTRYPFSKLLKRAIILLDADETLVTQTMADEEANPIIKRDDRTYKVAIKHGAGEQNIGFHVEIKIQARNGFETDEAHDVYNTIKAAVSDVFPNTRELN